MSDQLGFSEYIKSTLGTEKQIFSGDEATFHFAMSIDGMEEILDAGDIYALFWILDTFDSDEDIGGYLRDLQDEYLEAAESYEAGGIKNIDRHFRDGMHYTYCYTKKLPINDDTRKKAVKFFMSEGTSYKIGMLIVAYTIGRYIESMLEEGKDTERKTESAG